jgi:hypothetical protein
MKSQKNLRSRKKYQKYLRLMKQYQKYLDFFKLPKIFTLEEKI